MGSFVAPLGSRTPPSSSFDVNSVYDPVLRIIDLLWTRMCHPAFIVLIDLLLWRRPALSVISVVFWNLLTTILQHWPALFLACLAAYLLLHLCTKQATLEIN